MATRSKKTTTDEAKAKAETGAAEIKAEEEAAKVSGKKVQVTALQTIRCDGKTYKAGDPVPVSQGDADQLVPAGVAER